MSAVRHNFGTGVAVGEWAPALRCEINSITGLENCASVSFAMLRSTIEDLCCLLQATTLHFNEQERDETAQISD